MERNFVRIYVFTCSLDLCRKLGSEDDAEEVWIGSVSTKGYVRMM